jgi:hypothetical protein
MYMSRTQFLRMCRDTMLMGPKMDAVSLNLLFEKVGVVIQGDRMHLV